MPLLTENGYRIGTLCVIDRVPREMDAEQSFALKVLGNQVVKLFELRLKNKELKKIGPKIIYQYLFIFDSFL
jgi:hypothetical protein